MSAIRFEWPLRANIKTFSTSHNTIIMTITRIIPSHSRRSQRSLDLFLTRSFHYVSVVIISFFSYYCYCDGKQNHEIIALKVQIAWMHPANTGIHMGMILLRVLKINNVTIKQSEFRECDAATHNQNQKGIVEKQDALMHEFYVLSSKPCNLYEIWWVFQQNYENF